MNDTKILNNKQQGAVGYSNGPLLIIAGAGTGKTTVVTERIKHLIVDREIPASNVLALSFSEKAAFEMQERVDILLPYGYTNLWIHTFHSFCDRVLRDDAHAIGLDTSYRLISDSESLLLMRKNIFDIGLKLFRPLGNPTKFIDALLTHFSRLKDEDISPIEYLKWAQNLRTSEEKGEYLELANSYKKYEELKVKESVMDFSDLISNTLLLFRSRKNILKKYQRQFKFILVDEFQDTNYAQNELAILLAGDDKNITVVADDDQCLPGNSKILTPKGEIPIEKMKAGDKVITAVGKGHLSTSKATRINKNRKHARFITFITDSGSKLEVTDNHKMFCMIPARQFGDKKNYYVYLMKGYGLDWRLGITNDLTQRLKLERSADKIIGIKSYPSAEEALLNEAILSMRYQIPTYPFKPRKGMRLTGAWLEKLYSSFDTEENAIRLAENEGIDIQTHHFCLAGVVRGEKERIKITLNMCSQKYATEWGKERLLISPKILHEVRVESSSKKAEEVLKKAGIQILPAKKGWRIRKMFTSFEMAGKFAEDIKDITGGILEAGFYIGKRNGISRKSLIMPAKNILEGMYIPVRKGYEVIYERVQERKEKIRTEMVYDLEIENTHNFIANNIVIHNSIYRFRGAAVSNVLQFKKNFPDAKIITLTENYRSTQTILDAAYQLITHNNPNRLEVVEGIDKKLKSHSVAAKKDIELIYENRSEDEADAVARKIEELNKGKYKYSDIAILVRANNHSQLITTALSRHKIPYQFLGPGYLFGQEEIKDLIAYLIFLTNLSDSVSLFRVLSMEIFDISYIELNYLLNFAKKKNLTLFEALENLDQSFLKPETQEKLAHFREMAIRHLKKSRKEQAGQILYYFLVDSGLFKTLNSARSIAEERKVQNIAKFFDRIKNFETERSDANIFTLVEWLTLVIQMGDSPRAADMDLKETDAVNILTVHSSKGLEFKVIFLVNLVSDRFPSRERSEKIPLPLEILKENIPADTDFHLEEERRLFYVGMTRAKERLFFTAANYYGTGRRPRKISPFVYEALPKLRQQEEAKSKIQQLSLTEVLSAYENKEEKKVEKMPLKLSYITFSNLQMFDICPLHFKAKVIFNIPTPTAAVQSFGISIHSALYNFYKRLNDGEKPSLKMLNEILKKEWVSEGYDGKKHEEERFVQALEILKKFYETELKSKIKSIGLELPFSFTLKNGVKVFGKIDRIDKKGKGIEIIDYKTGQDNPKAEETHKLQLAMYALAATKVKDATLNRKPEDITLTLHFLEGNTKKTMNFKQEDLDKLEDELIEKIDEIEKSDFKCSKSVLCINCEYKMLCNAT